ncbi:MAG: arginine--tRNA ligase [Planctomycetes bacterium]|nr:arginine--tRNA ligase [Planctomycetota bacterium]
MEILKDKIAEELAKLPGFVEAKLDPAAIRPLLGRPPKREMGDAVFACFIPAKNAGIKPNDMAVKLAAGFARGAMVESAAAAGPYLNLKLNRAAAIAATLAMVEMQPNFGDSEDGKGKTLVLDFSSPNIAKPLAVHHLRTTMIGNAIKKIRESQGWRVVGINHLGDWGTGFGKLIAGLKKFKPEIEESARKIADAHLKAHGMYAQKEPSPLGAMKVGELNEVYKRFNEEMKADPALEDAGRKEFAVLEEHIVALDKKGRTTIDGEINFRIWRAARELSLAEFQRFYALLHLKFERWFVEDRDRRVFWEGQGRLKPDEAFRDHAFYVGESFYVGRNDLCGKVIQDAKTSGVAKESEGALVIFTHGEKKPPVMLLKSDGATAYHTRDLASALYRQREFNGTELAYVVGGEQKLHFDQLFKALKMLGHEWADRCSHVDFGLLLFKQQDGTWAKASTRAGRVVILEDLLDEAVNAVREVIKEKNADLAADKDAAEQVARAVGVGAVVFNDLKNGRRNDIKFDWDDILNFSGETGPYMLMQYVRMGSVTEKYRETFKDQSWESGDAAKLTLDAEWGIAQLIADFPAALARASKEYEPSIIAKALIDLAAATSSWWTATRDTRIVNEADAEQSRARVRLVNAIRKVLGRGLTLLGIQLVEKM